jgi:uncharacterized protein (TIGR00725 family)
MNNAVPLPDVNSLVSGNTSPAVLMPKAPVYQKPLQSKIAHDYTISKYRCLDVTDHKKVEGIDRVAVFGYADAKEDDMLYHEVVCATQALAKNGYTVVDGGGPGVMEAATVGAKLGGGKVIGVTFYPKDAKHFEGRDLKNTMDEEIITHNYVERTVRLLERGQVYLIFNGGTGTISEFGMAWGMARIYFGHHKPLILYGEFWPEIIATFKKDMKLRQEELRVFKYAKNPHDILTAITEFHKEIIEGQHEHLTTNGVGTLEGESPFTL